MEELGSSSHGDPDLWEISDVFAVPGFVPRLEFWDEFWDKAGHRIRQAMLGDAPLFAGPVEADETYVGGREFNKHETSQVDCWSGPQPAGDECRLAPWFRPAARECLNTIVRPRATEPDGDVNIVLLRAYPKNKTWAKLGE